MNAKQLTDNNYILNQVPTTAFTCEVRVEQFPLDAVRNVSVYSNDRVTTIGSYAFYYCSSLTTASFPVATTIGSYAFYYCSSLTTASFPVATSIGSAAFRGCYNLTSLTLGASTVCTLGNSTAFTSTPIGGYSTSAGTYGSIYVPASLLASYQTATNWSYFSSRFATIESLEGG